MPPTWEERYGKKRAEEMKARLRKKALEMYPTPFARKNDLKSFEFRDREAGEEWGNLTRRLAHMEKAGAVEYERQKKRMRKVGSRNRKPVVYRFPPWYKSPEDL